MHHRALSSGGVETGSSFRVTQLLLPLPSPDPAAALHGTAAAAPRALQRQLEGPCGAARHRLCDPLPPLIIDTSSVVDGSRRGRLCRSPRDDYRSADSAAAAVAAACLPQTGAVTFDTAAVPSSHQQHCSSSSGYRITDGQSATRCYRPPNLLKVSPMCRRRPH